MIAFLICAALLLAATIGLLVYPLVRIQAGRDDNDSTALSLQVLKDQLGDLERERNEGALDTNLYDKERAEIERRAIEDSRRTTSPETATSEKRLGLAAGIAIGISAVAIVLYLAIGEPEAFNPAQGGNRQNAHTVTPQQIQAMVDKLAERLQESPADGEGWLMLARSYSALGRYPEASTAYGRAINVLGENSQVLADYADVLAMTQGRSLLGDPERIIERARQADPRNVKAIALAGSAAFERKNYARAAKEWRSMLDLVPPDSDIVERIRSSITEAESMLGASNSGKTPGTAKTPK